MKQGNRAPMTKNVLSRTIAALTCAAALCVAPLTAAKAETADTALKLELNRATKTEKGCMFTFVAANKTGVSLNGAAFEFVFFGSDGLVEKMTAFDFGALPDQKTVVRQFEMPGKGCEGYGPILVNGASRCEIADPTPGTENICISALEPTSRTEIGFIK